MDEGTAYRELFSKLERERGFQGALYRQRCLRRRVAVRMRALGLTDPRLYATALDSDPAEYDRLLRTLTINVSKFFRNRETWDVIRKRVLPDLVRHPPPVVAWSAGCAAGEEAYSLAILAHEIAATRSQGSALDFRVVGTDIDPVVLESARAAVYPEIALAETPEQLRRRWFGAGPPYRLEEPVRSAVEFRCVDILAGDPRFVADLILCRNLLIYLDREAQARVFSVFRDVVRPGGYLVLGRVETLGRGVRGDFETVDARERVYKKK